MEWDASAPRDSEDLGIGLLIFRPRFDSAAPRLHIDTVLLHAEPAREAPVVGALIADEGGGNAWWRYAIASPERLVPNLDEFYASEDGSRESGLPIDSVDGSGRWVRGILGFDARGVAQRGWAELRGDTVAHSPWATFLVNDQAPLGFRRTADAALYDSLEDSVSPGRAQHLPAESHLITPVEARGRWLRVRVLTSYDPCAEPQPRVEPTERVYWIRYLDSRGRPLVTPRWSGEGC